MMKSSVKIQGISLKEFREEIQENIYVMKENDEPEVQKIIKSYLETKYLLPKNFPIK